MSEQKVPQVAHAPYNFVEFPRRALADLETGQELPAHDHLDPALKTGEIRITLTARTPVFVSDGNKDEPHFFRTPGGAYALPGSTVRGMVRENMQILSFAPVRPGDDFADFQIYFREMAGKNNDITGSLKDYYHRALGVKPPKNKEDKATPEKVESGWIRYENGGYAIYPTKERYLRVSRKHPDVQQFQKTFPQERNAEKRQKAEVRANNARVVPVAYIDDGRGKVKGICPQDKAQLGMKHGMLLYTGKPVGRVPNGLYIFPEADYSAVPHILSKEDELSYREDWERRQNNLNAYYDPAFWKLPESGEAKPVFYTRFEGHTYCGMSLFLRIGYEHPLSDGLPEYDKEMMDYPRAILGYAGKENSYRSRVSFSDCIVCGKAREMAPIPMILAEPKPSYYAGYVKPDEGKAKHYNDDNFELRGYKQYWLKEPVSTSVEPGKEKVGTTIRPLDKGTQFTGVVRFKNLTAAELGLLLWSLRLEKGCFQTIGMGKPYGYGRMELTIDSLTEYTLDDLYGGDICAPTGVVLQGDACAEQVKTYIRQYDEEATAKLALLSPAKGKNKKKAPQPFSKRGAIRDFFWMKSQIQSGKEYCYMELEEYKGTDTPLCTVNDLRKKAEEAAQQEADILANQQDTDDPMAKLQAMIAKRNQSRGRGNRK